MCTDDPQSTLGLYTDKPTVSQKYQIANAFNTHNLPHIKA